MAQPIYIVRHGQTPWNAELRLQGQSETDLNETGRAQARANGEQLARLIGDPSRFNYVASPMRRTRQTMEIVRGALSLPPDGYATDVRLMELNYGDWEAFTFAELDAKEPGISATRDHDKWRFRPPGDASESYEMLAARVRPLLESAAGPLVVVTHGGILRVAFHIFNGMDDNEAASMEVPQNRVAMLENGRIRWLNPE